MPAIRKLSTLTADCLHVVDHVTSIYCSPVFFPNIKNKLSDPPTVLKFLALLFSAWFSPKILKTLIYILFGVRSNFLYISTFAS